MLDALKARHDEYKATGVSSAGQSWIDKHEDIGNVQKTIEAAQAKLDQLHSLNRSGSKPAAASTIDHSAIDAELKRRGL
jgi:uncharacterized coiled-coil DUF342 family protein